MQLRSGRIVGIPPQAPQVTTRRVTTHQEPIKTKEEFADTLQEINRMLEQMNIQHNRLTDMVHITNIFNRVTPYIANFQHHYPTSRLLVTARIRSYVLNNQIGQDTSDHANKLRLALRAFNDTFERFATEAQRQEYRNSLNQ